MTPHRTLVTGGNKGIGKALVRAILEHAPDTSVILGSRDLKRGEAARDELGRVDPTWAERIAVVALDVADDASVHAAARSVEATFGADQPLYGLVNNAGIGLGEAELERVLNVNTFGPKRVFEAFSPLLQTRGRVVNISSASGPNFVAACGRDHQKALTDPQVTWSQVTAFIDRYRDAHERDALAAEGLGKGANAYGLSKACLNAYTLLLARTFSNLVVNACTPGFIATDLTLPYAESRGMSPEQMGMKPPAAGTVAAMHLLFGEVGASGWYFGSDALRSPLDRYRSPGAPAYTGP